MDWDRIITQMIHQMIQQCFAQPSEFFSFRQLARRIPGADADVLHAIAESRSDLFVLTKNSKSVKLEPTAIEPILQNKIDLTSVHAITATRETDFSGQHI